jgi:DNA-directed RNA polymerase subunit E'/Rpb7
MSESSKSPNNDSIYRITKLKENIHLTPKDINKNINDIVLNKLKKKVEGKCIQEGFIRKDSVKVLSRSLGVMNNSNFESGVHYIVVFTAEVCSLNNGQVIEAEVENIDKSQVISYIGNSNDSPVEIYMFKHHHVGNSEFASLSKGDIVKIKVSCSKYDFNDKQIVAIGSYESKS